MCYTVLVEGQMGLKGGRELKKSILFLIACLILCQSAALAAVSVRLDEGALLLRENGDTLVPLGVYADIVDLGGVFAAEQEGAYLLLDEEGAPLSDARYSDLRRAGDFLLVCQDGRWGMMDLSGLELVPCVYEQITGDESGNFWALSDDDDFEAGELVLLDGDGAQISSGLMAHDISDEAAEGLIGVQMSENGLWGYADARGALVIPATYSHVSRFQSGRAVVVLEGRYGVIDVSGEMIVPAEYDAMEISPEGFILATKIGEGVWLLDFEGEEGAFYAGTENYAAVVGKGFSLYDGIELLLYDASGECVEKLSRLGSVYEGLNGQWILSDGAWGETCVRLSGTQTLYQNLYPLAVVDGEALYVSMRVNAVRYASQLLSETQLAVDMENARYGVVDGDGAQRVASEYERITYLGSNRLLLYGDGLWQMTDAQGEVLWTWGAKQSEEPNF